MGAPVQRIPDEFVHAVAGQLLRKRTPSFIRNDNPIIVRLTLATGTPSAPDAAGLCHAVSIAIESKRSMSPYPFKTDKDLLTNTGYRKLSCRSMLPRLNMAKKSPASLYPAAGMEELSAIFCKLELVLCGVYPTGDREGGWSISPTLRARYRSALLG